MKTLGSKRFSQELKATQLTRQRKVEENPLLIPSPCLSHSRAPPEWASPFPLSPIKEASLLRLLQISDLRSRSWLGKMLSQGTADTCNLTLRLRCGPEPQTHRVLEHHPWKAATGSL